MALPSGRQQHSSHPQIQHHHHHHQRRKQRQPHPHADDDAAAQSDASGNPTGDRGGSAHPSGPGGGSSSSSIAGQLNGSSGSAPQYAMSGARRAAMHQMGPDFADDGDGVFISSSRDASEEDNDDASGLSDSASSLRVRAQSPSSPVPTPGLPTSARDRALAESHPSRMYDKTPSSTSPPRHHYSYAALPSSSSGAVGAAPIPVGGATTGLRRPSASHAAAAKDRDVAHTLEKASAALSGSSGGSSVERRDSFANAGPAGVAAGASTGVVAGARASKHRNSSVSSAGSRADGPVDVPTTPGMGARLELGSLPPPVGASASALATPAAVSTPNANPELGAGGAKLGGAAGAGAAASGRSAAEKRAPPMAEGDDDGVDGATASPYDGDVEFAARTPLTGGAKEIKESKAEHKERDGGAASSAGGIGLTGLGVANLLGPNSGHLLHGTAPADTPSKSYLLNAPGGPATVRPSSSRQEEVEVTMASPEEIREYIRSAIEEPDPLRDYSINPPPEKGESRSRPVRIYADGVYDLFHYAHMLQLRQAKLFFPSVYLIVGVVSSESCAEHKNEPVLHSSERYASVRNCRWVDEVVEDAPWVIDQEFLDRYRIDYVAHDEAPYGGKDGHEDIYRFVKDQGKFLPTRRTPGVSTSELLGRIVELYRRGIYDEKLIKIGLSALTSAAGSERALSEVGEEVELEVVGGAKEEGEGVRGEEEETQKA